MSRLRNVQDACYDASFLILLLFDHKRLVCKNAKTQLFRVMNELEDFWF